MEVNYLPDDESIANVIVLEHSPIKAVELCTMTSQEIFPSCQLMEVCVSLYCTITKQTQYW